MVLHEFCATHILLKTKAVLNIVDKKSIKCLTIVNQIRKVLTERVTVAKHSERKTVGESFLCRASAKTTPELQRPNNSKCCRIPALKDKI